MNDNRSDEDGGIESARGGIFVLFSPTFRHEQERPSYCRLVLLRVCLCSKLLEYAYIE